MDACEGSVQEEVLTALLKSAPRLARASMFGDVSRSYP
jgi:hypothetical protein